MSATVLVIVAAGCAALAILDLAASGDKRPAREDRSRRLVSLLAAVGRRGGRSLPVALDLTARLAAADAPAWVRPADVVAVKAGGAVLAALAAAPLAGGTTPRVGLTLVVAAAAAAFIAPDVWLGRRARARAASLAADLPDVLDLVRVAVAAGLPVARAFAAVSVRRGGLLAQELGRTARAIDLGVARAAALRELGERCPLPGVLALVAAIDRSDRHGTALAPTLAAIASDARHERVRRRKERADKAAPKIQLIVALLLVPAAMLLLVAGMLAGMPGA